MRDSDDQAVPRTTGFASPAEDYAEQSLNLHKIAVRNSEATYFWEVKGDGMRDAGISPGDIMVIDRAVDVVQRDVVVVAVQGEYLVRRWLRAPDGIVLLAEHPDYAPLFIMDEADCRIWGVVVAVLHYPNRKRR